MSDAAQFRLDLERFTNEVVPKKAAEVQRRMTAEALTMIVQMTPVGNNTRWQQNKLRAQRGLPPLPKGYVGGHARKNWRVSVGSPSHKTLTGVDASGQQALSTGYQEIAKIEAPTICYIANPLPYMQRLEEGWSKQAPQGMVKQAVAAISAKYARVTE